MLERFFKLADQRDKKSIGDLIPSVNLRRELRDGSLFAKIKSLCMFTYKSESTAEELSKGPFPRMKDKGFTLYNPNLLDSIIKDVVDIHFWDILEISGSKDKGSIVPADEATLIATTAMLVRRYLGEVSGGDLVATPLIDPLKEDHYRHAKDDADKPPHRIVLENQTKDITKLIDGNRDRLLFLSKNVDIKRLFEMHTYAQLAEYILELAHDPSLVRLVEILDSKAPMVWFDKTNRPKFSMVHYIPLLANLKGNSKSGNLGTAVITGLRIYAKEKLEGHIEEAAATKLEDWSKELDTALAQLTSTAAPEQLKEQKDDLMSRWVNINIETLADAAKYKDIVLADFDDKRFLACVEMGKAIMGRAKRTSISAGELPMTKDKDTGEFKEKQLADEREYAPVLDDIDVESLSEHSVDMVNGISYITGVFIGNHLQEALTPLVGNLSVLRSDSRLRKELELALRNIKQFQETGPAGNPIGPNSLQDMTVVKDTQDEAVQYFMQKLLAAIIQTVSETAQGKLTKRALEAMINDMKNGDIHGNPFVTFTDILSDAIVDHVLGVTSSDGGNVLSSARDTIKDLVVKVIMNDLARELEKRVLVDKGYIEALVKGSMEVNNKLIPGAISRARQKNDVKTTQAIKINVSKSLQESLFEAMEFLKLKSSRIRTAAGDLIYAAVDKIFSTEGL